MKYDEIRQDIFIFKKFAYMAHCIASDFRMRKGIAVSFQKKFNLRSGLFKLAETHDSSPGTCLLVNNVFNLITKRSSSGKPTYKTLESSLESMRNQLNDISYIQGEKKLLMPKIGCGLDRLQWGKVRKIIKEVFLYSDVEIIICKWK